MKQKRNSIIICVLVVCILTVQSIKPKTEAKAFYPVVAGVALISAACWTMGIYGLSNDIGDMAEQIYLDLDEATKNQIDNEVSVAELLNQPLNKVSLSAELWNTIKDAIAEKIGPNPSSDYNYYISKYGDMVCTNDVYSSVTSPIDVKTTVPVIADIPAISSNYGNTTYNFNGTFGAINWQLHYVNSYHCLDMTFPDGTIIRLRDLSTTDARKTQGLSFFMPIIYDADGTQTFKFFNMNHGAGSIITENDGIVDGYSTGKALISTDGGVTFGYLGDGSISNAISTHMLSVSDSTIPLTIDTERYSEKSTTQAVDDMSLLISTDLDKLQGLSADQIGATEEVGLNVLSIGQDIVNALQGVTTGIVSAVQAGVNTITSAINSIATFLYDAIVSALTYVFVPTLSLTSISDIIIGKLNLGFTPQTSFSSQPIAVDIPLGTYTQHMVLDNSLWSQFRAYMAGFVYFSFAWLFYKKVVSIGGND